MDTLRPRSCWPGRGLLDDPLDIQLFEYGGQLSTNEEMVGNKIPRQGLPRDQLVERGKQTVLVNGKLCELHHSGGLLHFQFLMISFPDVDWVAYIVFQTISIDHLGHIDHFFVHVRRPTNGRRRSDDRPGHLHPCSTRI